MADRFLKLTLYRENEPEAAYSVHVAPEIVVAVADLTVKPESCAIHLNTQAVFQVVGTADSIKAEIAEALAGPAVDIMADTRPGGPRKPVAMPPIVKAPAEQRRLQAE